jgi:hypothetical protein
MVFLGFNEDDDLRILKKSCFFLGKLMMIMI